ncbi:hypothetical protein NUW58_g6721 [Xylaria curta]|uniref:Uncharacterized protein n=1 Tax=Xylaria curta TaxID=42375 RepID=A0ACC1NSI5_9PEZI|nr:hypothetical protein NUW58_g6721 [Xylaria curta]
MKTLRKWQYQMKKAEFPETVAPFSVHHAWFEFDTGFGMEGTDSEAWTEYFLEGTSNNSKKFMLWLTRKSGWPTFKLLLTGMSTCHDSQGSEIDLGFQRAGTDKFHYDGTVAIVAGKEDAFVTTSRSVMGSWMYASRHYLNERTLRQICMPGTHNSGMHKVTERFGPLPPPNSAVVCQTGSVWDQLRHGIRCFDIRPVVSKDKGYYTGHFSPPWGATGQSIRDVVNNVNDFTYNNAELVILSMSHDMILDKQFTSFGRAEWDGLFRELDRLTHRFYTDPRRDLSKLKLKEFTGNAKAAVIVTFDFDRGKYLGDREGQGYFYRDSLPVYDSYANKMVPKEVVQDQIKKLHEQRTNPDDQMFVLGWAVTQQDWTEILKDLVEIGHSGMNPRLGGDLYDQCSSKVYPNILSMDGNPEELSDHMRYQLCDYIPGASSVPAQNYYAVGSQPGSPYAAHSSHTPYAAHSSHVPYAAYSSSAVYAAQSSAPYVAHSAPAQNYYVVATPSGSSSAHHPSTSSIPKQSQYAVGSSYVHHPSSSYAATSVPAQNEYGVGSSSPHHPSASYAATSVPAQNEYGVGSSSHHSPAPYAATSIPAQNQYAVGSSPVHHAPASSIATTIPKQSQYAIGEGPAPYSEASYAGPSVSHPHHDPPAYASAPAPYATSYTTAPSYVTETSRVTSAVYAPAAPSAVNEYALDKETTETTNPAVANSQCGQQCIIRGLRHGREERTSCPGEPADHNAVAHDGSIVGSKAKANGKPSMDNPPVTFGAGTVSFEACMESCKSKFQHADIAFDVSTGKSDCKAACAAYSAEGAGVNLKRADKPKPKSPLNPPEPVFAAGAGTTAYQACLKQCHYEFQSADIALPVSQGKGGCAQALAPAP